MTPGTKSNFNDCQLLVTLPWAQLKAIAFTLNFVSLFDGRLQLFAMVDDTINLL